MNIKRLSPLVLGVAIGAGSVLGLMGTVAIATDVNAAMFGDRLNTRGLASQSLQKVTFPRRNEGIAIVGDGMAFAPTGTAPEDLLTLPAPLSQDHQRAIGRFQMVSIEGTRDVVVLDTTNGLARHYRHEENNVRVYNVRVPNHVLQAPLSVYNVVE